MNKSVKSKEKQKGNQEGFTFCLTAERKRKESDFET